MIQEEMHKTQRFPGLFHFKNCGYSLVFLRTSSDIVYGLAHPDQVILDELFTDVSVSNCTDGWHYPVPGVRIMIITWCSWIAISCISVSRRSAYACSRLFPDGFALLCQRAIAKVIFFLGPSKLQEIVRLQFKQHINWEFVYSSLWMNPAQD